jgi:hypothetical protein
MVPADPGTATWQRGAVLIHDDAGRIHRHLVPGMQFPATGRLSNSQITPAGSVFTALA